MTAMLTRRPDVIPFLIAFVALSCTSPKSANLPLRSAGLETPSPAVQGRNNEPQLSVAVDLRDGSRIVGTPLLTGFTLVSSYGSIAFKLEQVNSIIFTDSAKGVSVQFRNGDMLQGSLQVDSLPVQFSAGRMNLPISAILRLSTISARENLAEGLIAHYPLVGNTKDATGHGHDAINHGAVPAPDRFGRPGHAYEFDGAEARISLPEGILDPNAAACTLSLWVLPKSSLTSREALYVGAATAEINIFIGRGKFGFGADLENRQWYSVETPAQENTFVHLAAVYVRGKSVRLYVNGERKSEAPLPDLPLLSGLTEYTSGIGSYAPEHPEQGKRLGISNWYGSIADVRIYNRALSDEEILSLAHYRE
jgi:hypothetical protein